MHCDRSLMHSDKMNFYLCHHPVENHAQPLAQVQGAASQNEACRWGSVWDGPCQYLQAGTVYQHCTKIGKNAR